MSYFIPTQDIISRDLNLFYQNLTNTSFGEITGRKLVELKFFSKELNRYFNNDQIPEFRTNKYLILMNKIRSNPKVLDMKPASDAEKYILFMFAIDPTFEAFIIHSSENKKDQIVSKLKNTFGVYDPYLIALERYYIKTFLPEEKRKEINDEIMERIYYPKEEKIRFK